MKVLVTGAAGFLGSYLCRRMVEEGHGVRALMRPTSDFSHLRSLPIERHVGDVTDFNSVASAVCGQDWVIHAAAVITGETTHQTKVNVEGTRHIARACREAGVRRLVHVSSVAAVGIPNSFTQPADENFQFNLENCGLSYHVSKYWAERAVIEEVMRGIDAVIVNPAEIKGPYRREYRGSEIIRAIRRAPVVPYFTGGLCVVHVQDVVQGIVAALNRGKSGERYILGGENLTFKALGQSAASAMHLRRVFVPLPSFATSIAAMVFDPWARLRGRQPWISRATRSYGSRYRFYDSGKARRELGYAPRDFHAILDECLCFDS